jgi:hypothetical protein
MPMDIVGNISFQNSKGSTCQTIPPSTVNAHSRCITKTSSNRIPRAKKNDDKRIIASAEVICTYIRVAADEGRLTTTPEIVGASSLHFCEEIASIA